MAGWKIYTVDEIATEVHQRSFLLPVVQRRLVWSSDKMELLFDTLLKGDAFGGVIVIEEQLNAKPLFESRPFSQDGETHMSAERHEILRQKKLFVIDGQQRLQTFFMGLFGSFQGKPLYFDLYGNHQAAYEFRFAHRSELLDQVSGNLIEAERSIRERRWQLVPELYKLLRDSGGDINGIVRDLLVSSEGVDSNREDALRANLFAFHRNIFQEQRVGIDAVSINRNRPETENRQRIVELFRRLNDGGTVLSSYDLFASILKGLNWQMESFLDEIDKSAPRKEGMELVEGFSLRHGKAGSHLILQRLPVFPSHRRGLINYPPPSSNTARPCRPILRLGLKAIQLYMKTTAASSSAGRKN